MFHSHITTIPCVWQENVIQCPYNVIFCRLESCLVRSLQARSLRQQWHITTQIWVVLQLANFPRGTTNQKHYPDFVVTRHQYGISALVSQTSFGGETSGSVVKCRLFSHTGLKLLNSVCASNEMNQDHQKWSCSCLKQGSKINDFCFKQAQGLKSSVAHLYPNFP